MSTEQKLAKQAARQQDIDLLSNLNHFIIAANPGTTEIVALRAHYVRFAEKLALKLVD